MVTFLRTMTVSELTDRASRYASTMAEDLERFDAQHPYPQEMKRMTKKERERIEDIYAEFSRPTREQMISTFQKLFCLTMASHYTIIPDEP